MDICYRVLKESDDEDYIRTIWKNELLKSQTDPTSTCDYIKRRLETDMGDIFTNYIKTGGTFFVAETGTGTRTLDNVDTRKIIGFVGVFYYKDEWTMARLNVLEPYRRHTVGTLLCRAAIDWFGHNHPGKTLNGSTDITNKAAYDLLHKVGFKDGAMLTNTITTMVLDPSNFMQNSCHSA
jgi:GNAT superfamily N-acetyltransferase